ncbi:TIGR03084 family protein [Flexivirga sp. ID2601S]|uniref:TIGR03084 family protein n=1 Tax=Flexivirga aerilata TaxID=1656889 RepID=A0A849AAM8_9MICO|nr:TIGR03084 family metal-binding protein [Flexivirga aerilata]NNG37974.1 TIGR03084 family protein [Flexivirga aerilata]
MLDTLLDDLRAESAAVRDRVAGASSATLHTPTPAAGWDVAHQIAHLTWTDEMATSAVASVVDGVDAPHDWNAALEAAAKSPETFVDDGADELAALPADELLARWDASREALAAALRATPADTRIPWFGPPMKATSMATARIMETWAHGLDVAAALGAEPEPTDRIRHVCHLGVATRGFVHSVRGLPAPETPVYVELVAPSGETWTWGDAGASDRITGPAWDFARVAVRRLHPDDTTLVAEGAAATEWLGIVQAFAGPPGDDPVRRTAGDGRVEAQA